MIEHIWQVKVAWEVSSLAHLNRLVIYPGVFNSAQKLHFCLAKPFQAQQGPTTSPFVLTAESRVVVGTGRTTC